VLARPAPGLGRSTAFSKALPTPDALRAATPIFDGYTPPLPDLKPRESKIDLNRGVIKCIHPHGIAIHMYVDEPGVYLTVHGRPVAEKLAEEAGFDIAKWRKQKRIFEMRATAETQIRKTVEAETDEPEVVAERGTIKVIDIGLGRYQVVGEDDLPLHTAPLTREQAMALLDGLVPVAE
jgi:hypothetical protein